MRLDQPKARRWLRNPWMWIACFFILQFLGSLGVIRSLKVDLWDVYPALAFLLAGFGVSAALAGLGGRMRMTEGTVRWLPAVLYALFIFSLSHRSFSSVSASVNSDLFHPLEYWSFSLLLSWALEPLFEVRSMRSFSLAVLGIGLVYGIGDEIHQAFIPGRTPSLLDLALDMAGVAAGWGTFMVLRHLFRSTPQKRPILS
ncbi:MAG TPA: VanZ family protein [Syntrophobacteraceae bacterium]|nr:VanZ family protein [Syntrophobacteraceae bacterium]